MKLRALWILCVFCLFAGPSYAADVVALEMQVKELSRIVQDLRLAVENQQREITSLKAQAPLIAPQDAAQPATDRPVQGRWNPDIGVVADTLLTLDSPKEDAEGADRVAVRELEIAFGSAVDAYSRLDATLGIADFEEMSIEEAYYTHFDIFGTGITGRVGRFLPRIGKSIPLHRDSLDTVDEPMVIEKYFGHHGYNKTGADITRPLDLPWAMTHRATVGVLEGGNGEEGALFGETRRTPTVYSSLKNYLDLNDSTGLEIGLSHLAGSRDDDESFEVNVLGVDGTVIYRYADQRHVKLQSEAYFVNRTESFYEFTDDDGVISEQDLDDARHLNGGYVLFDWRFDPKWAAGFRFDDVQLIETAEDFANPQQTQRGYTGYLTFYQSEFARWRVQYSHIDQTDITQDDDRVYVQGTFAIGEHKHN